MIKLDKYDDLLLSDMPEDRWRIDGFLYKKLWLEAQKNDKSIYGYSILFYKDFLDTPLVNTDSMYLKPQCNYKMICNELILRGHDMVESTGTQPEGCERGGQNGDLITYFYGNGALVSIVCARGDKKDYKEIKLNNFATHNPDTVPVFVNILRKFCDFYSEPKLGSIYIVSQDNNNKLILEEHTNVGSSIIRENYGQDFLDSYDHIVEDLKNKNPCGRIVLFDGPPGTGKTYAIRGLLEESYKNTIFVFVPSYMTRSLGEPNFLKLLLTKKDSTVVLIVEDADECLSSRKADNISAISTLLNMTDGVMDSIIDIRVICSTNIKADEVDEAILRDGRLCKRIEVGGLGYKQANEIYKRLTGQDGIFDYSDTGIKLCEVYKAARNTEKAEKAAPTRVPKRVAGFLSR